MIPRMPSKADRLRIFSWNHQPIASSRGGCSRQCRHADADQLDVRVLQRRLAAWRPGRAGRRRGSRAPAGSPRPRARPARRAPGPGRAPRPATDAHAGQRAHGRQRRRRRRRTPRPRRRGRRRRRDFSSAGRALGDDPAAGDDGDPVAQLVGLEHVVGGEQHGRAALDAGRRRWCAARGRRPGRCRCAARRGTAPRAGAAGRGRCAAAAACPASSPRPAPSPGRPARPARAARRCAPAARAAGTPYSSAK